ncbi:hydroxysqualene dehydroxylase [Hymenobacter canadensis]|uniref:FAD-dependent oxidoreductase n=1 Tax=Hymenobacter canadensis TaxID=2999067 RepID=A0ABY7LQH5_9BACT|nr:FAD-dependent oxidoreductase [Hymenobacter canadensis]WBA40965.1 FAD-dependent oxidoreductase [Hymenobacter canadensis]
MPKKVVILGGGVAGMSAAHELIERGFAVEIYERQPHYVGGKARSVDVPDSATPGHQPLPGEHGFRFFPGFYRHITDTMKRIPYGQNRQGVFDNLVPTQRVMMARTGKPPVAAPVNFPKTRADWQALLDGLLHADTGLTDADKKLFADRVWQLLTSSYERRQQSYERVAWWQYMSTDQQCGTRQPCPYELYCVGGLTHSLVAAQPQLMSTKTGGDILLQLLLLMANPGAHTDRVLNGPTNDVWLNPWLQYLKSKGVVYHHNQLTTALHCDPATRLISGATLLDLETHQTRTVQADYYLAAVPLERMAKLISPDMVKLDPTLGFVEHLSNPHLHTLNWMNGVQFYLREDVQLTKGHVICIDSPWAITVISQPQFWPGFPMSGYGDGQAKGLLSVDVSNWFAEGVLDWPLEDGTTGRKQACDCTLDEIVKEVWAQLEQSLNTPGLPPLLGPDLLLRAYVDADIRPERLSAPAQALDVPTRSGHNDEPLLVNTANSWSLRPEASTGIANLFLAADYVRTNTDLATMEGANEAARRAVNGIIAASGAKVPTCRIWELHEPGVLAVLRWLDRRRFAQGLPWTNEVPWLGRALHRLNYLFHQFRRFK